MKKRDAGFSLVETLVGSAVLVIFFAAISIMAYSAVKTVGETRVKTVAVNLAQERLEIIRNMPYDEVGTVEGIPAGVIETPEVVTINNFDYTIDTYVVYVDDPYDGEAPIDTAPTDYKRVKIAVTWDGVFSSRQPLVMRTDVVPEGLETDEGGGTLIIQVIDADGEALEGAEVTIDAQDASPSAYIETASDMNGLVELPGAPECTECYKITVTKSGYTTHRTYGPEEVDIPNKPHLSVEAGKETEATFKIDKVSTVTFRAVRGPAYNYTTFQGVQMRVHGQKEIGRTVMDEPVYKYDEMVVTGAGGQVVVPNMEWDRYTVEIPAGSSIDFAGSWPFTPFSLLPDSSLTFTAVVVPAEADTLLVRVMNNLEGPINTAQITLINESESFIATKSTAALDKPDRAQAHFTGLPSTLTPYSLTISSPGYLDEDTVATVSGDVIEQFLLNPED